MNKITYKIQNGTKLKLLGQDSCFKLGNVKNIIAKLINEELYYQLTDEALIELKKIYKELTSL